MTPHERALVQLLMEAADRALETAGEELRELAHALRRCETELNLTPVEEGAPPANDKRLVN